MPIKRLSFLCLLCLAVQLTAQAPVRRIVNFDDDWKFHLGHAADVKKDFNYGIPNVFAKSSKSEGNTHMTDKFDDSNWQTVQLPHDWAVTLPFVQSPDGDVMGHGYKPVGGLFPDTSIGWYRKSFTIDQILAAPPITYPLTLPMCAPLSDGAAAVILCTEEGLKRIGADKSR